MMRFRCANQEVWKPAPGTTTGTAHCCNMPARNRGSSKRERGKNRATAKPNHNSQPHTFRMRKKQKHILIATVPAMS